MILDTKKKAPCDIAAMWGNLDVIDGKLVTDIGVYLTGEHGDKVLAAFASIRVRNKITRMLGSVHHKEQQ